MRAFSFIAAAALGYATLFASSPPAQAQRVPAEAEAPESEPPEAEALGGRPANVPPPEPPQAPEDAPLETEASGLETPIEPEEGAGRVAARVALYPVRGVWWVAMAPLRGVAYAFNRWQLKERYQAVFFSEDLTRGLLPTASYQSGLGVTGGLSFRWKDIESTGARLGLKASYGGEFLQNYSASLTSGEIFSERFSLEALFEYRELPNARFFGLGNGDEVEVTALTGALVDPIRDDTAVATRFRHDTASAGIGGRFIVDTSLDVLVSSTYRAREFEPRIALGNDSRIFDVYDPNRLVGYVDGLSNVYSEVLVTYDRRRELARYHSSAAPSTGYFLSGFFGFQKGVESFDPSQHGRWGIDLQRYIDLFRGDRTLTLRLYVEGVTGRLEEVPFIDLPALGGPIFLRGYRRDRFRDRNVALASIEYGYPISRNLRGYLFVDAGAPFGSLEELEDWPNAPRIAYGGGLQINTINSFIGRLIVGTNIDGGFQFTFSFDPTFQTTSREDNQ